ncbi:uncharacterized protein LOC135189328 isoform X1 [Pogoniulus pusillus]|uniref:uncharacterized protein LOC135189328 isoform X1 n=1 Tax=Pogoniulus pusillus TaxID=488313 RepID=UPI0030B98356
MDEEKIFQIVYFRSFLHFHCCGSAGWFKPHQQHVASSGPASNFTLVLWRCSGSTTAESECSSDNAGQLHHHQADLRENETDFPIDIYWQDRNPFLSHHTEAGSTYMGSMLLLPGLLAISLWSCKPFPSPLCYPCTEITAQAPALSAPHRIFPLLLPGGDAQVAPKQNPDFAKMMPGSSVSLACTTSEDAILHWYRQLPGEPPKRILYFWRGNTVTDDSGDKGKFEGRKHPSQPLYGLTIYNLSSQDSSTYYCAHWLYDSITALDRQ